MFQSVQSLIALMACLLALTHCTSKNEETIRIGEVGSMTGTEATFGTSTHHGIMLALEQINAQGGVHGKKIEVIALDNQGKPEEAATAITKLITQNQVKAVIGEVASSRTLAMAPIAQSYKVPLLSPASTNPKVTETGDYVFRVCFIDPFQGHVMAKFAKETLKAKKVAILKDMKSDYSIGLAQFFMETFKKLGGEILIEQSYSGGDIDFKSQLTAIRGKTPDAIFVPGYYTEVGLIARQARELGIQVPLLGGDGWDSPKLTEIGGKALHGNYFSNHYSSEDQSPAVKEFINRYRQAYNSTPDAMAALGYDAIRIMAEAMKKSPHLKASEIRDALAGTKDFAGVTGKITMDEKRNVTKSAVVLKIDETGVHYLTTVAP